MRYYPLVLVLCCFSYSLSAQTEAKDFKNVVGISPINYFADAAQEDNTYAFDGMRIGISYNRKLSERFNIDIPVFVSYTNQFISFFPGIQYFPNKHKALRNYFSLSFAYDEGRTVVCSEVSGSAKNIDIARERMGIMLGWAFNPMLSNRLALKLQMGSAIYFVDDAFEHGSYQCENSNSFFEDPFVNLYYLLALQYHF